MGSRMLRDGLRHRGMSESSSVRFRSPAKADTELPERKLLGEFGIVGSLRRLSLGTD
jgi:hypothetical protein